MNLAPILAQKQAGAVVMALEINALFGVKLDEFGCSQAAMGCQPSDFIGINLDFFVCAAGGTSAANKGKGR